MSLKNGESGKRFVINGGVFVSYTDLVGGVADRRVRAEWHP
jgi:hypothetical protein